jgi:hypothetical protein
MKKIRLMVILGMLSLAPLIPLQAGPGNGHGNGNGNGNGNNGNGNGNNGNGNSGNNSGGSSISSTLSSVPVPELPATGATLVTNAKNNDKQSVALEVIDFTASDHPSSIAAVVAALVGVLPNSAPLIASTAAKLLPNQASAIANAATGAAPNLGSQITSAINSVLNVNPPNNVGTPNGGNDQGNRPSTPPGLNKGGDKDDHEGTIRGNRPPTPPGHERDPKPGRDDNDRRHYGSP